MIDPELRDIIAPELETGEELVWVERPQKHSLILLISALAFFIVFGLLFFIPTLIAIITKDPSGLTFNMNGVPADTLEDLSGLIPLLIFIGPTTIIYCWFCYYSSKRIGFSTYAVSNRRAFIKRPNRPYKTLALDPQDYDLALNRYSKKGSIFFKKKSMNPFFKLFVPTGSFIHPVFFKIKNPGQVEALILKDRS